MRLALFPKLLGTKVEIGTTILEREATALRDNSCTEPTVVAVYEAASVAIRVRDGEVDGV